MTGCDLVSSFDPLTGKKFWEIKGATTECVTSTVTDGQRIFTSGGYPKNHVAAVNADGSGKVAWENGSRVYVPSMIAHDGHLYGVLDAGVAVCWKSDSGKEVWRGRLGGTFSASLVLADGHLFATNEAGLTFVYRATPDGLKVVAKNQLGQEAMATPAVCGGRIYLRTASREKGQRQEMLYCIAAEQRGSSRADAEMRGGLAKVAPEVLSKEQRVAAAGAIARDVRRRTGAANARNRAAWAKIETRQQWEAYRDVRLEALRRSLGEEPPTGKLKVRTTGRVEGDGFRIDNVVYESRPGQWVPGNLYVPTPSRKSMPVVLIAHAHHRDKPQSELQDMGMTWREPAVSCW